jgi:serine/threonine protein kinase
MTAQRLPEIAIKKQDSGRGVRGSRFTLTGSKFEKYSSLAEFDVLGLLGKGSFADVYEVVHRDSKRRLALKCIHKSRIDHDISHYCYNEKQLLAKLEHSSLVKLYCTFQNNNFLFMVMELCPCGTLRDLISQPVLLPEASLRLMACELVEVIGYLHGNCVIYRDLKPENTGLCLGGHIKLLDLGLAKEALKANTVCGSHAYLAPEIVRREEYSFAIDWYMLGLLIYELIAKKTPFAADSVPELEHFIMFEEVESPLCVSAELQDLLQRLLDKNPVARLGYKLDAEELREHPWFRGVNWQAVRNRKYNMSLDALFCSSKRPLEREPIDDDLIADRHKPLSKEMAYMEEWESSIRSLV